MAMNKTNLENFHASKKLYIKLLMIISQFSLNRTFCKMLANYSFPCEFWLPPITNLSFTMNIFFKKREHA